MSAEADEAFVRVLADGGLEIDWDMLETPSKEDLRAADAEREELDREEIDAGLDRRRPVVAYTPPPPPPVAATTPPSETQPAGPPADFVLDDHRGEWPNPERERLIAKEEERLQIRDEALRRHREKDADRAPDSASRPLFADIAAALAGGVTAPVPDGGPVRTDGVHIFYRGKVNVLYGDPESGKSLIAFVTMADALNRGETASMVDTDHNGLAFVLGFLRAMGVSDAALISRFSYCDPEDRDELLEAVSTIVSLDRCTAVFDSLGENLTIWGVSANDDMGVIELNRATAAKVAKAGHLVLVIDHMAKNVVSRNYGSTGSTAKKRQVDGVMFEVVVVNEFSKTDGGKNAMILRKDRNGGVRGLGYKKGDTVAFLEVTAPDPTTGQQGWVLHTGTPVTASTSAAVASAMAATALAIDVAELDKLSAPPKSKTDVMARMKWGTDRALAALNAWRAQQAGTKP
jgi:hypothetical protein